MPGTYISPAETGLYYLQSRYYNPALGRFINGDAFATTGQGLLGNNMFAYCCNTPVSTYDPSGCLMVPADPYKGGPTGPGSTAGLGGSFGTGASGSHKPIKGISSYKGVPVIVLPIDDNAFSFGFIFIGENVKPEETLPHEYGHSMHFLMAGPRSYTVNAFIPSVLGFWFGGDEYDKNYYSHIYEYTAEVLGNVNRTYSYSPSTEKLWGWYLLYTVLYP